MSDANFWKNIGQTNALLCGFLLLGFSLMLVKPVFTFRSDLIEIRGTIDTAYTDVETVSSRYSIFLPAIYKSQKSSLLFKIKNNPQTFLIFENIGENFFDEKYEGILYDLKKSKIVSVWVPKKSQLSSEPKIYEIYADQNALYKIDSVKKEDFKLAIYIFILSLICFVLFFRSKSPGIFKKGF